jgi:hypothetical protein
MHDCIGQIIRRGRELVVSKEPGMAGNPGPGGNRIASSTS